MPGRTTSHSEEWWLTKAPPHILRCVATLKSTGAQCRRVAVDGSVVCDKHGGKAPQVIRRAAERVQFTADDAARNLVAWMNDPAVEMRERVKIAHDLMDRAGLAAAQVHKVMPITEDPIERFFKDLLADPDALLPEGVGGEHGPGAPGPANANRPSLSADVLDVVLEVEEERPPARRVKSEIVQDESERIDSRMPRHIRDALAELL